MADAFDAYQYFGHLRARWRFFAVAVAVAVCGSLLVSLLLPKKYTATVRILIEPPPGFDVRSSMVISPIYLETLKTYEHFASSDSLFLRALDRFRLRDAFPGRPVESIKKSVLQVEMPRNTKILEIRATLAEAKQAHDLALFVADETLSLNRSVTTEDESAWNKGLEKQQAEARAGLERAQGAMARFAAERPGIEELADDIDAKQQIRETLQRQILAADLDAAGAQKPGEASRGEIVRKRLGSLENELKHEQQLLAERRTKLARLETEQQSAQETFDNLEKHLTDARAAAGYRGEQLRIIDPGIVPERPSSPNVPLNVMAAALLALMLATAGLSFEFAYRRRRPALAKLPARAIGSSRDD